MHLLADSHCHIDAAEFDPDRDAVLRRARDAGVDTLIAPAVDAAGWDRLEQLCAQHAGLHPAFGLHPVATSQHRPEHLVALHQRLRQGGIAVGECGLDFWDGMADAALQHHYFEAQLVLAREFQLPVIVHARRALDTVIACLRRAGPLRGVVHSFSGSWQQAEQLWRLGFLLGIGGPVTYPRAQRLRRTVTVMPIEHLLLETDSPDQPDAGQRGQRNEPARLATVLDCVAELRGTDRASLAAATRANCHRLFNLPSP
ncbi:MAG TPA: TatD family hydrolase [Rhodanobacteraceae bacterium]|nr:TatD family hydrolase [Rhodanobacteraceae bacterium]